MTHANIMERWEMILRKPDWGRKYVGWDENRIQACMYDWVGRKMFIIEYRVFFGRGQESLQNYVTWRLASATAITNNTQKDTTNSHNFTMARFAPRPRQQIIFKFRTIATHKMIAATWNPFITIRLNGFTVEFPIFIWIFS